LPQQSISSSFPEPSSSPSTHFSSPPRGLPRNSLLTSTETGNALSPIFSQASHNLISAMCSEYSNRMTSSAPTRDFTPSSNHRGGAFLSAQQQQSELIPFHERDSSLSQFPSRTTASASSPYRSREEDIHEDDYSHRHGTQRLPSRSSTESNTLDALTGLADRTPLSAVQILLSLLSSPHPLSLSGGVPVATLGCRFRIQSSC
jgi:hypothetical protein